MFISFLKNQAMKILLNISLQSFCNLNVRIVTKEGAFVFCNKYLDCACVNK